MIIEVAKMDMIKKKRMKYMIRKNRVPVIIGVSSLILIVILLMNIGPKHQEKEEIVKEKVADNIIYGCILNTDEERILVVTQANYFIENECLDDGSGEKYKEINKILSQNGFSQYSEGKYTLRKETKMSEIIQLFGLNRLIIDFENEEFNRFCKRK